MDNCEFSWISLIQKYLEMFVFPCLSLSLRDYPILSMHIYFLKGDLGSFKKGVSSIITQYLLILLTAAKMPKFQVSIL